MAIRSYVSLSGQIKGQSPYRHTASSREIRSDTSPKNVLLDLSAPASSGNCAFVRFNSITSSRMKSTLGVLSLHLRRDLSEWIVALAVMSLTIRTQQQRLLSLISEGPLVAQKMLRMLTEM
jgi:hypothetical protein